MVSLNLLKSYGIQCSVINARLIQRHMLRFEFATSIQSTRVPSLLPEAHLSILPYLSLPAHLLRSRALDLQKDDEFFGMVFYPDVVQPDGADNVLEGTDANGLVGINRTSFMVSYMSPRW